MIEVAFRPSQPGTRRRSIVAWAIAGTAEDADFTRLGEAVG